jgi:hypothetical protein
MKQILKWTGIGTVIGYVVLSLATTTVTVVMMYASTQQLPVDLKSFMLIGSAIGAAYGAYKAGFADGSGR